MTHYISEVLEIVDSVGHSRAKLDKLFARELSDLYLRLEPIRKCLPDTVTWLGLTWHNTERTWGYAFDFGGKSEGITEIAAKLPVNFDFLEFEEQFELRINPEIVKQWASELAEIQLAIDHWTPTAEPESSAE